MKKLIFTIIFTFLILGCKNDNPNHYSDLKNYSTHISNGEYIKAIEYMPSEFWEVFNKSEFIIDLKKVTKQIGKVNIKDFKINYISEIIKSEGKSFKIILCTSDLEIDSSSFSNKFIEKYKLKLGTENVILDAKNSKIILRIDNQMIYVYDKKLVEWRYLEFKPKDLIKIYGLETLSALLKHAR